MKSIRERRGEKVQILVPLFKDSQNLNGINVSQFNSAFTNDSDEETKDQSGLSDKRFPGFIYMDSMHFGMGCSCL